MFYNVAVRAEYREEPCTDARSTASRGMPFDWSLNPYMGCVHRCTLLIPRRMDFSRMSNGSFSKPCALASCRSRLIARDRYRSPR